MDKPAAKWFDHDEVARLVQQGRSPEAIAIAERALAMAEKDFGPEHPDVATALGHLAVLHRTGGDYEKAEPLYLRALAIREKAFGAEHPEVATALNNLAALYESKGDYEKAGPLYERALAIDEKVFGPEHPELTTVLNNLAMFYANQEAYEKAEPLYERALAIDEKAYGPDHPEVATDLNNLAVLYSNAGDYERAEPLYQRALAICEKAFGPKHSEVATALNNLATLYESKDDYKKAEPLYERVLAIDEEMLGPEHPDVATALNNLAGLYESKGAYEKAERLYQRALAITEKAYGRDHLEGATPLNNLAGLYERKGDYAKAEPLYERALAIFEKACGPQHLSVATLLNNLAVLYKRKGDDAKAEPLYERALAIREKALGLEHPSMATPLNNLAGLYESRGDYEKAESFYRRALLISEKALGLEHLNVAATCNNLAALYKRTGDYENAELFFQWALTICEQALGPKHPDVATALNNLAALYDLQGNRKEAKLLYGYALAICEEALGPKHPYVATTLNNLAALYTAEGDAEQATALQVKSSDISEHHIALNLATGSERQKRLYLATFLGELYQAISLHTRAAPSDPGALRLALTTVLRRKGRVLDAMAESIAALRRRLAPPLQDLLGQLTAASARLAALTLGGPGQMDLAQYRGEIRRLEEQIESLEDSVSRQSVEFRAQSQTVTLEAIQAAIPGDARLVEFVCFNPYNAQLDHWEPRRYVAYVVGHDGLPAWVDLGEAVEIDRAVKALRAVLRKYKNKRLSAIERKVKPLARALDQLIMQPIRKLIGDTRELLLSPDGALNLIPFAALVDEQGNYMVQNYLITYLTTGRDLLRLQMRMESQQGVVVFAELDYEADPSGAVDQLPTSKLAEAHAADITDSPPPGDAAPASPLRAAGFSLYFEPLPGAEKEAKKLKKIFPETSLYKEGQATKRRLNSLQAPAILHIATHGFFLDEVGGEAGAQSRGLISRARQPGELTTVARRIEDPLLRSGLALTGANWHFDGDYEGILTAKEASGLNLWGTRLVVLSACDTGVGEVKNGEGVYGLRRALVLAGSETQVMSLWPVHDAGTGDLMIAYYKALKARQGRSEALRQVQLRMLANPHRKHPHYWASFIQSGEWANLDGQRETVDQSTGLACS